MIKVPACRITDKTPFHFAVHLIELALHHLNEFNREKSIWFKEINLMGAIIRISNRKDLKLILDEIQEIGIYSRSKKAEFNELTLRFIDKV